MFKSNTSDEFKYRRKYIYIYIYIYIYVRTAELLFTGT